MSNCIEHTQTGRRDGYATTSRRVAGKKITELMHRAVYVKYNGVSYEDIVDKHIRHTCDNSRCINPEHLEVGTRQDNMNDMIQRDRVANGQRHHNAKLNEEQVLAIRRKWGAVSAQDLSNEYGISVNAVNAIITRRSWKRI